jgi:hypothetical protein
LPPDCTPAFTNWLDDDCDPTDNNLGNEPNDDPWDEDGDENCLELNASGQWNDQQCVLDPGDLVGGYIAEWCEGERRETVTGGNTEEFPGLQFVSIQQEVPVPCVELLIIPVAILEICKETEPETDDVFEFTLDGWAGIDRDFELEGDGDCEEYELFEGNYTVTEHPKEGWVVSSIECDPNRIDSFSLEEGWAVIDLRLGDQMKCVWTNVPVDTPEDPEEEEEEEEDGEPTTRPDISGIFSGIIAWLIQGSGQ